MRRVLLVAVAAAFLPSAAQATAFTNGDFETGPAPGSFTTLGTGSTALSGWIVSAGSVDYIGSYWQPGDGARSVDLSGGGPGTLSQTFDTVAGKSYVVTFLLAGNPDGGPVVKPVTVSATGNGSGGYSFDTTGHSRAAMGWQSFTYNFTATGISTTLSFASGAQSAYGPALDGVSVTAVPEPAGWALLIAGFGLVGGQIRRRRRIHAAI